MLLPIIPPKTVERLSQYRRLLSIYHDNGGEFIFSYELSALAKNNPAIVRRDILNLGNIKSTKRGYEVVKIIYQIDETLEGKDGKNVALVGLGNLGRALLKYFSNQCERLMIVAIFDNDPKKIGTSYFDCPCYPVSEMGQIIKQKDIFLGIICTNKESAQKSVENLAAGGVKGILSFAPGPLVVPDDVHLEEVSLAAFLDKTAYFGRMSSIHVKG